MNRNRAECHAEEDNDRTDKRGGKSGAVLDDINGDAGN